MTGRMEFFAVALFFLVAWGAFTWLLVRIAMATVADMPGKPVPQLLAAIGVVGVCWLVPNIGGLQERYAFSKVTTDCGWTVYKKAPPVEGIYADVTPRSHMPGYYDTYLGYYGKVQHETRRGEIGEVARGGKYVSIPARTLRYGIRLDREDLPRGVERYTQMVMDYDKNEVLAKYVVYDLARRSNGKGVAGRAFDILTAQPEGCKQQYGEFQRRLGEVLPGVGAGG